MNEKLPRICFVAPSAFPLLANDKNPRFAGGAELQHVLIARALARRGYPVSMICLDFGQEDGCVIDGVTVFRAFRRKSGIPVLRFLWPRLTGFWSCLKRADADIYYHRAASMLTGVVVAFARRFGRKSIFAVAGETHIRFRRDRWLFEYGIRHADRIIVQNLAQATAVREKVGRESTLIANLCMTDVQPAVEPGRDILWVGMIRHIKRPDVFLDVVERLPQFRFVMIGGSNSRETELFHAISARVAGIENLEFPGFVPYDEIDPYFDRAAVFVNTSESEGFPNTFLQAWIRGVPTVSFVDSGARLGEEEVGVHVRSAEEMSKTITMLMNDDVARKKIGQRSRQYAEANHSESSVIRSYEKLFRELIRPEDMQRTAI